DVLDVGDGDFEKVGAVAPAKIILSGDAGDETLGGGFVNAYQAVGGVVGDWAEKDGVHDGEDGGIGSYSQGEDEGDGEGEQGILAEPTEGVLEVAEHTNELVYAWKGWGGQGWVRK